MPVCPQPELSWHHAHFAFQADCNSIDPAEQVENSTCINRQLSCWSYHYDEFTFHGTQQQHPRRYHIHSICDTARFLLHVLARPSNLLASFEECLCCRYKCRLWLDNLSIWRSCDFSCVLALLLTIVSRASQKDTSCFVDVFQLLLQKASNSLQFQ